MTPLCLHPSRCCGARFPVHAGTMIVFNRGLVDYRLFGELTTEGVYFVTRLKDKADFRVVKRLQVPANRHILRDEIIRFTGF